MCLCLWELVAALFWCKESEIEKLGKRVKEEETANGDSESAVERRRHYNISSQEREAIELRDEWTWLAGRRKDLGFSAPEASSFGQANRRDDF